MVCPLVASTVSVTVSSSVTVALRGASSVVCVFSEDPPQDAIASTVSQLAAGTTMPVSFRLVATVGPSYQQRFSAESGRSVLVSPSHQNLGRRQERTAVQEAGKSMSLARRPSSTASSPSTAVASSIETLLSPQ